MADRKYRMSSSFNIHEVEALIAMIDTVRRGGDSRVIVRHPTFTRAEAKFRRMRELLKEKRCESIGRKCSKP